MKLILLPLFWLACTTAHLQDLKIAAPEAQEQEVITLPEDILPINLFFQFN